MRFLHVLLTSAFWLLCAPVYAQALSSDIAVLEILNEDINRSVFYRDDPTDVWQSPKETLALRTGDCEDYAILKLFRALQSGVSSAKLRMLYVRATATGSTTSTVHMALGYFPEPDSTDPLVLDNLIGALRLLSQRQDLRLVLSFNGSSVWMSDGLLSSNRDSRRLFPKWTDVLYKAYQEGFPAF